MLQLAVEEKVCKNAFLCIICDGYASGNAMRQVLDSIKNDFKNLHFLIDGMPLNEKLDLELKTEIVKRTSKMGNNHLEKY